MAHANVIAAFRARLAANWSRCAVKDDNNTLQEPPAPPFIEVLFPVASAQQMSVGAPGANLWREEGGCLLVLNIERGAGAKDWAPWADELAAIFRGKNFDGVQTFAPTSAEFENSNEDGNFYQIGVAITYQYDLIG
ncbi:hypothetical protein X566_20130 [Afipia sp. P52-10]|uniref:phage tail terminator-like protein n=1 Tax=Afipia sp. P52-10 TaxID=1429916 RepID=UPI0003DF0251|nr:phage tail terminator-like protein [Afipia sp. P52-10]ETR75067.1 hypothetical protein X566_20130 [Afipia sp. P52-10]